MRFLFLSILVSSLFSGIAQVNFTESTLPIVIINTGGINIPDEPKITAQMGIIYNGPGQINNVSDSFNVYNGHIGIEQRGSSSLMFAQKSYSLETRKPDSSNLNVSLFGWPQDNDYILHAPYTDKSLMRNVLTYKLGNDFGRWAPRTQFCEVILNGEYIGVYVLLEKIKQSPGRVDINKLRYQDTLTNQLTGGYIIKIDKTSGGGEIAWVSPYLSQTPGNNQIKFQLHDPKLNELHPLQKNYIQDFITNWETALKISSFTSPSIGYKAYIDVPSFIDYFLITELSKNVDGYRISTFLHKQRQSEGGKLVAGPLWDYNIAWGNADYCQAALASGWEIDFNTICGGEWQNPFWWKRLLQDPLYANDVQCRWTTLRQTLLSDSILSNYIDSIGTILHEPALRHYQKWPILGAYVWPNYFIGQTYQDEVGYLKNWVLQRAAWLDANMFGICTATTIEMKTIKLKITPNPTSDFISIEGLAQGGHFLIYNLSGQLLKEVRTEVNQATIDLSELSNGIYIISAPKLGLFERIIKTN